MDRKGIINEAMDWIHLAEKKFQRLYLVHTAIGLRVSQNAVTPWLGTTITFSRQILFNGVSYDILSQNKTCVNMYLLSVVKKSMFKVSKCHCFFNSNYSIQITHLTHALHNKIPAKLNASNRPAQTFTNSDTLWRSDSKGLASADKKCHIEWLRCYEE